MAYFVKTIIITIDNFLAIQNCTIELAFWSTIDLVHSLFETSMCYAGAL